MNNDIQKIKKDIEFIKKNMENILQLLSNNKNTENSIPSDTNNTINDNIITVNTNTIIVNDIQKELNDVLSFDNNISIVTKPNRFLNIMKEERILSQSTCELLIKECLNYTLLYNWNKMEYNNCFVDIIEINKLKNLCNLLSDFLHNNVLPKIIDLYKLKNNSHICFKLIDLFIYKCNNENDISYMNVYSKKTIFSFLIPINKNNNDILFEPNQIFNINIGEILIYCGNQKCILRKTDNVNNYFLIGNIDFYFYK